jgi:uncharacterized protein (TIGR00369 family)
MSIDNKTDELLNQIHQDLGTRSLEELEQVQHVLASFDKAKAERLHYLGHFLGIELHPDEDAKMHLGMHNGNTYGVTQGGALYAFADIDIGYRIMSKLSEEEKVFTLEMKMNYVKPGQGNMLIAKTDLLHWGRQTVVAQCRIEDESGDLVAHALGTFFVVR